MFLKRLKPFMAGIAVGLAFAPIYFLPGIFGLSYILSNKETKDWKLNLKRAYLFGFGMYIPLLYWIAIGVSVYIDQFWWAIPFALFGLPAILAFFPAAAITITQGVSSRLSDHMRYKYLTIIFMICWVFFEWLVSWIFTGLPWGLLGYIFSVSLTMSQGAADISVYGLSVVAAYVGSSFFQTYGIRWRLIVSIILLLSLVKIGDNRLQNYPTDFTDIKVRLVQPSIPQEVKWEERVFWDNLNKHIELSKESSEDGERPDIIIWSEAALTRSYYYTPLYEKLIMMLTEEDQTLITGAITDNSFTGARYGDPEFQIYSSIIAMDVEGDVDFEYHKSHLVPFGEYMPLKAILPTKKLTPGLLDYTEGQVNLVKLTKHNLMIKPQICYEAIFAPEVRVSNKDVDVIINVTNDSWYGKSSGPYQHFEMSRMRAIENGLPLLRVAGSGISAIVDPVGRVLQFLPFNEVGFVDGYIPRKLPRETVFSRVGLMILPAFLIFVLLLHELTFLLTICRRKK